MSLELARGQIEFARAYTLTLLDGIEPDQWFAMPQGCRTHLAWQVGHLAFAQYGLALFRQRGRQEVDLELMTSTFRKQFGRGSVPQPDVALNPSVEEILTTFERVYKQVLLELPTFTPEQLAESVDMPYAAYPNKLGCLLFCSHHEMLHAGQIGVIRRLLGKEPVR